MNEHEQLDETFAAELRAGIRRALDGEQQSRTSLRGSLEKQGAAIKAKEANLVDLAAEGVLERSQIRERMNSLQLERGRLEQRLGETATELHRVLCFLDSATALLERMQVLYERVDDPNRRLLNQALFEAVYIEDETEAEPWFKEPSPPSPERHMRHALLPAKT